MTVAAAPPLAVQPGRDTVARILAAGLAGGVADFLYASGMAVAAGRSPARPWESVAAGWLGREAAGGGPGVVALGVATHFAIALAMAAAYLLLVRRIPAVAARPLATAPLYGLALYAVMYLGVLPLRWPGVFPRWNGVTSVLDVLAHVGVALAIAWVAVRPTRAINPKPGARAGF